MRHGKRDANHAAIRDALRQAGASVFDTADLGGGFPDLVVGWRGVNLLLEVKMITGKLTDDEIDFAAAWNGQKVTVRSVDEALAVLWYN